MFEFADSVFGELMGVIVFEVVENDRKYATCAVAFVTKSAAKLTSDMTVVANFLVLCCRMSYDIVDSE